MSSPTSALLEAAPTPHGDRMREVPEGEPASPVRLLRRPQDRAPGVGLALLAAVIALSTAQASALAQSSAGNAVAAPRTERRETLLGVTGRIAPSVGDQRRDPTSGPGAETEAERNAASQLEIAREALAGGGAARARAILDELMKTSGADWIVEEARTLLRGMSPGKDGVDVTVGAGVAAGRGRQPPNTAIGEPAPASATSGPPLPLRGADRLDLRAQTRLESLFRAQVGDRVFFHDGVANLDRRALPVILTQAAWLVDNPLLTVVIEGHADDSGSEQYNAELALRRAMEVRARLVAEGVKRERIEIVGHGRSDRVATCGTMRCAHENRRVTTLVRVDERAVATTAQERSETVRDK